MHTCTKLIPYYAWETDAVETWLAEQAKDGWELVNITFHSGNFRRTGPKSVRYRLDWQALGYQTEAETEYLAMCTDAGWNYVCPWGDAYVFRTADEDAAELQSDDAVYLHSLRKMLINSQYVRLFILTLLFNAVWIQYIPIRTQGLLRYFVYSGLLPLICLGGTVLLALAVGVDSYLSYVRVNRRVKNGEAAEHNFRAPRAAVLRRAFAVCAALLCLGLIIVHYRNNGQLNFQECTAELSALPFHALADIAPDEAAAIDAARAAVPPHSDSGFSWENRVAENSTFPAPKQFHLLQGLSTGPGFAADAPFTYYTWYSAQYFRFLSEKLAVVWTETLANGFLSPLDAPGFDTALYGVSDDGGQSLLLRRDKTVLWVRYRGSADLRAHLDIFAEKLR